MPAIPVPDIEGPTAQLCWAQKPDAPSAMVRCDRRQHHKGLHSWERDDFSDGKEDMRVFIERAWRIGVQEAEYEQREDQPRGLCQHPDPNSIAGIWWKRGYDSTTSRACAAGLEAERDHVLAASDQLILEARAGEKKALDTLQAARAARLRLRDNLQEILTALGFVEGATLQSVQRRLLVDTPTAMRLLAMRETVRADS